MIQRTAYWATPLMLVALLSGAHWPWAWFPCLVGAYACAFVERAFGEMRDGR